jgi:hypothetical protein
MELDGCKVCQLFGGPHAEHAGWNGASVLRQSAAVPSWEEVRKRNKIDRAYKEATESDDLVDEFVEGMSQPVTGEVVVPPGYVRAPQSERGYVPALPTQDEVDRLLTDALAAAYVGQTVRLTVLDKGTGERATFSVIKRSVAAVEVERLDRIRELESTIRHHLQEGER